MARGSVSKIVLSWDGEKRLNAFCDFSKLHVSSWDIDPMYPILARLYENDCRDENRALWRTFLYVALYHAGSAQYLWEKYPDPDVPSLDDLNLKTGTERRSFRGRPELLRDHIDKAVRSCNGDFLSLLKSYGKGTTGWDNSGKWMRSLPHGGPWSAYKWADLLLNTHGADIEASDLGIGGGGETAGPIPGMVIVTGRHWKVCASDLGLQYSLLRKCRDRGVDFNGLDQLETSLCDFNSLCRGRYYIGHDIDQNYVQMNSMGLGDKFIQARSVLPDKYRGEINGWTGVDKGRNSHFFSTGEILDR